MLAAALYYALRGWAVFPVHNPIFDDDGNCVGCTCEAWRRQNGDPDYVCQNPGKCPRVRWSEKSTTDKAQIHKWWGQPWAWDGQLPNIGIDCGKSGILAFDVDSYKENAGDLTDFLTIAEQETVTVVTGSGGQHLLYAAQGKGYGNNTGTLPAGIDVRGEGGYIVAAPSLHKSGAYYSYEECYGPRDVELCPIPPALDAILAEAHKEATASIAAVFSTPSTDCPNLSAWRLSERILSTINNPPSKGERSEADMSVCVALVYAGTTDDEILSVFEHYPIGADGKFAERGRVYLAHTIGQARAFVAAHPRPEHMIAAGKEYLLTQDIGRRVPDELKAARRNEAGEVLRHEYRTRAQDMRLGSRFLDIMQTVGRIDEVIINAYQIVRTKDSANTDVQIASHKTVAKVLQRLCWFFDAEPTDKPNTWKVSLSEAFRVDLIRFPVSEYTVDHGSDLNSDDSGNLIRSTFDHWKADDPFGAGTSAIVRKRLRKEVLADAAEKRQQGQAVTDFELQAEYEHKLAALLPGLGPVAILIIHTLRDAGGSGATASELAEAHGLTSSAVSGVLRKLRTIGLVDSRRRYKQASLHFVEPHAFEWITANEEQFRTYKAGVKRLDRALESAQHRSAQIANDAPSEEAQAAAQRRSGRAANKRFATIKALHPDWTPKEIARFIYAPVPESTAIRTTRQKAPVMPEPGELAWYRLHELTGKVLLTADEFGELQALDRVLGAGVGGRHGNVEIPWQR